MTKLTPTQTKIVIAVASVSLIAAALLILYYYFVTNVTEEEIAMYKPKYFSIRELSYSSIAVSKGIDNTVKDQEIKDNLSALIMKVLDPLREKYGKPITISSGYRCAALNKAVGGASSSQHTKGQAADISTGSKAENKKIFELIKEMGEFDQLINESDFSWVHVSYKMVGYNRKQILNL